MCISIGRFIDSDAICKQLNRLTHNSDLEASQASAAALEEVMDLVASVVVASAVASAVSAVVSVASTDSAVEYVLIEPSTDRLPIRSR